MRDKDPVGAPADGLQHGAPGPFGPSDFPPTKLQSEAALQEYASLCKVGYVAQNKDF